MNRQNALVLIALLLLSTALPAHARAPLLACAVVRELPHDAGTSTQGLFLRDGIFYESSGGYGRSFLAKVDPETGRHLLATAVDPDFFAEGIAPSGSTLRMVTWQSGIGMVHRLDDLSRVHKFVYRGTSDVTEGWGLTFGDGFFILSTGTDKLRFHAPDGFTLEKTVEVRDGEEKVTLLNELEYVEGLVYANIWKSDEIVVIDPKTGMALVRIDLSPLRERLGAESGVANGIAYDAEAKRLYVTGKHWDKLFEIAVPGL